MGKGFRSARRRGEGYTEYLILVAFIMVCSVVGLLTAGSKTLKKIRLEKGLCVGCDERDKEKEKANQPPPAPAPPPSPTPSPPPSPAPAPADPPPSENGYTAEVTAETNWGEWLTSWLTSWFW